ncbi:FtsK/SpoIIIE domain-containing protein [Rugosimonospora acidiphila]|uniref:FtsK/SpoIIIE domain-containing protein n=1 Tax=Rugosimonospora acidiphila TaxID=556531 RepID=A0ABP9RGC2_9ACTN
MATRPWVNFKRLSVRVPWWIVMAIVIPVAAFRLARFVVHHRRAIPGVTAVLLLLYAYLRFGWLPLVLVALAVAGAVGLWAWRAMPSCRRFLLLPVLGRWRGFWVYRRQWAESLSLSGLHKTFDGMVLLPRLVGVRCREATDEVTVRMLRGQNPELFHKAAVNLAYSFGTRQCRVFSTRREVAPVRLGRLAGALRLVDRVRYRDRPRLVTLVFFRRDPLTEKVEPFEVPPVPDFTALVVGLREDAERYALRLLATHVLVAGATRAGKGSVIWSLIRALAGGVASGLVRLWVVDPKGGMELAMGQPMFARYEYDDFTAMADLFDQAVSVMRKRQAALRGLVRVHTPTLDEPLIVIVIDEIAALTAYLQDGELRSRIAQSLGLLLSQGAGLGVLVVAATQDPRKETVGLRDLFPTRIALRLNEPNHADLVLGDGARDRGALADQIPVPLAGVGFVRLEGHPEPARLRFSYVEDALIREMAALYPAPVVGPFPARVTVPTSTGGSVVPRQRPARSTSLKDGPLLPSGLLDALGPRQLTDGDQP